MFDGKLGTWKKYPLDFELKYDAKPIFSRPYPVMKLHIEMFKKEVEHVIILGFLEREKYS